MTLQDLSARLRAYRGIGSTLHCSLRALRSSAFGTLHRETASGYLVDWSNALLGLADTTPTLEGREHLEPGKSYIFMSNHRSLYDIPTVVLAVAPHPLRLIAKAELFRIPLWGKAMWEAEIIKLDRSNREQAVRDLEFAGEKLREGLCLWIAPEGGRTRDGKLRDFKKGGFMMALKTGASIVPIGIVGTEDIAPVDVLACYKGAKPRVSIGQPIDPQAVLDKHDGDITTARDELMGTVRSQILILVARAEEML
jgi:1-acyl-sn-glycerol-3-phosphate acyltransferase